MSASAQGKLLTVLIPVLRVISEYLPQAACLLSTPQGMKSGKTPKRERYSWSLLIKPKTISQWQKPCLSQWEFFYDLNKDSFNPDLDPCVPLILLLGHSNLCCLYLGFEPHVARSSMACSWLWSLLKWFLNATSKSKPNTPLWQKGKTPVFRTFAEVNRTALLEGITPHMALESFRRSLENARFCSASPLRLKQLILFCCSFPYGLKLN